MAISLSTPSSIYIQIIHLHPAVLPSRNTTNSVFPLQLLRNRSFLSRVHPHAPSPLFASNPSARPCRCPAVSPGRPPPPESEPPTGKDPSPSAGPAATLARLQDTMQIFFAVLFWMSLFFWSSIWDGRNNGRPSKGSRFRR